MRERWVRIVSALTGLLVILLAWMFAWVQNPQDEALSEAMPLPATVEAGRVIFLAQHCTMCHAIGGEGNPRSPLDDAGLRHDASQLRDWILATGAAGEALAARTVRMKQDYRGLAEEDLDALVAYLQWVAQGRSEE